MDEAAERYLNEKQVAERLNIRVTTLRGWRVQKVGIPFSKMLKLVRYRIQDVEAFEAAARTAGEQQ